MRISSTQSSSLLESRPLFPLFLLKYASSSPVGPVRVSTNLHLFMFPQVELLFTSLLTPPSPLPNSSTIQNLPPTMYDPRSMEPPGGEPSSYCESVVPYHDALPRCSTGLLSCIYLTGPSSNPRPAPQHHRRPAESDRITTSIIISPSIHSSSAHQLINSSSPSSAVSAVSS